MFLEECNYLYFENIQDLTVLYVFGNILDCKSVCFADCKYLHFENIQDSTV